jgi:heme-degrading monooxygenase HmoA
MFARMFTIEGCRERLDEFSRLGENKVLPALQRFDGFEGSLVLENRQNGHILIVTFWHSEEAMHRGRGASHWFRVFVAEAAGGEVTNVERYEVVHSDTEDFSLCSYGRSTSSAESSITSIYGRGKAICRQR